jgi:hypothetical protein
MRASNNSPPFCGEYHSLPDATQYKKSWIYIQTAEAVVDSFLRGKQL